MALRTLLLAFGVLVVSTAYVLLLSTSETIVAQVTEDLREHYRPAYDLIVRGPESVLPQEHEIGAVRLQDLSALRPSITLEQYRKILEIPQIEVAAPISVVGVFYQYPAFRYRAPAGLYWIERIYRIPQPGFAYERHDRTLLWYYDTTLLTSLRESEFKKRLNELPNYYPALYIWRFNPKGKLKFVSPVVIRVPLPFLLMGIDPEAESRLVGLEQTVIGEMLPPDLGVCEYPPPLKGHPVPGIPQVPGEFDVPVYMFPVLLRRDLAIEIEAQLRLTPIQANLSLEDILVALEQEGPAFAKDLPTGAPQVFEVSREDLEFQKGPKASHMLDALRSGNCKPPLPPGIPLPPSPYPFGDGDALWPAPEGISIEKARGGVLSVKTWGAETSPLNPLGEVVVRSAPRQVLARVIPAVVGTYNPRALPLEQDPLLALPLGTYLTPEARVLALNEEPLPNPEPLKPGLSPLGYLPFPAAMLTNLKSACAILGEQCISAIRVKVAGVEEFSPQAQAKIEAVAAEIMRRTGLHVDVVAGASPRPMQVHLPGTGKYPDLLLQELWMQKGVHLTIHRTVQKGNQALFGFLLALTVLYTANAGAMWVMGDLWKWALRRALGWRDRTVLLALLGRGLTVGLVAGALGLLLGWGLKVALGLQMEAARLWPILPLSVGLVLLGLAVPAVAASRTPPLPVLTGRWWASARPRTGALARWLGLLAHHPRELVLAALMAAGATGLLTLVMAGLLAFRGYLALTLLGQYLLVHLGPAHGVLLGVTLLVTGLGIVDVVLLLLERHGYLTGLLQALGWRPREVRDYWVWHGLALALVGGVPGGLGALALLTAGLGWRWAYPVAGLAAVALVAALAVLAAWLPARRAVQRPPVEVLRAG